MEESSMSAFGAATGGERDGVVLAGDVDLGADQLLRLRTQLRGLDSVVIAFSGGVDSALLLRVAHDELGDRVLGLTAVGPSLSESERRDAARIANWICAPHRFVESGEIHDPNYRANSSQRCFHCKSELYRITEAVRSELGFRWVANGTNLDDLEDYRPGLAAAKQAGVRSPLVEAGFDKKAVRAAAKLCGLDVWDKPAAACLSSRIPYGTEVTEERLARIERFEGFLRDLDFRHVRVRFHESVARIEVAEADMERALSMRSTIVDGGKNAGFAFVALDLLGYRIGSLNVLR